VPQNDEGFFAGLCGESLERNFQMPNQNMMNESQKKLDVICGMHFESYFLVMRAIFKHCETSAYEPRYAALPTGAFVLVSLESPLWIRSPTVFLWLGSSTLSERLYLMSTQTWTTVDVPN